MALGEFMAGSAVTACIHCAAAHSDFLPGALARAGLLLCPLQHHVLSMKASALLTVKSDCSLMCEAALQNSETSISDWRETTEENWLLETPAYS